MQFIQAIILGLVQGVTEFLPVSSSGHLIIAEHWLGFTQSSLTFDLALHVGTLGALVAVFWSDYWELGRNVLKANSQGRLARILVAATVPALLVGVWLEQSAATILRSVNLVALNLVVVALVMLLAERQAKQRRVLETMTLRRGLGVGLAQAAAVVPGVSRSGITIAAGLLAGFDRVSATRFSFLLSLPVTAGAVSKVLIQTPSWHQAGAHWPVFAVGAVAALASGYWSIKFLLNYLTRHSLAVFAYYRIILGGLVLLAGLGR
jgi:undecaprenyl-diphosphatase